jgi:hypothetical protein
MLNELWRDLRVLKGGKMCEMVQEVDRKKNSMDRCKVGQNVNLGSSDRRVDVRLIA